MLKIILFAALVYVSVTEDTTTVAPAATTVPTTVAPGATTTVANGGSTSSSQSGTRAPIRDCTDTYQLCAYWKSKGECSSNRLWMFQYCQAACNPTCTPQKINFETCEDTDAKCVDYANTGGCLRFRFFMVSKCPKVCAWCKQPGVVPYPNQLLPIVASPYI